MINTTEDAFLSGRLTIRQPAKGYRAGADPVFLAASIPAKTGDSVLELGCGVGTALYCLMARVAGLTATGVEINASYATLAQENAALNDLTAQIHTADITQLPADVRDTTFDHVFANPPYFERSHGSTAPDLGRETGRGETVALLVWIDCAVRRIKPGGTLTLIQRANRLPDLLSACDDRLGGVKIKPLTARAGRPAKHILLQAKKGARAEMQLLSPLILHSGDAHDQDGDNYSPEASQILRDSGCLDLAL